MPGPIGQLAGSFASFHRKWTLKLARAVAARFVAAVPRYLSRKGLEAFAATTFYGRCVLTRAELVLLSGVTPQMEMPQPFRALWSWSMWSHACPHMHATSHRCSCRLSQVSLWFAAAHTGFPACTWPCREPPPSLPGKQVHGEPYPSCKLLECRRVNTCSGSMC